MENRIVKLSELTPYDRNPRISKDAVEKVALSIQRFGFINPIITDENLRICCGHQRYKAATKIGMEEVPVRIKVFESEEEFIALNIADNKTAEASDWDEEIQFELEKVLHDSDFKMEDIGYNQRDINLMIRKIEKELSQIENQDEVPESAPERCHPGDLWILGDHRLKCGDSTSASDVQELMNGEMADICFTSPPYNVGSNSLGGNKNMVESKYINDDDNLDPDIWKQLLTDVLSNMRSCTINQFFNLQQLAKNKISLIEWIYENRSYLVDTAIWFKGGGNPSRVDSCLDSRFEYIFIFSNVENPGRVIKSKFFKEVSNVYELNPSGKNKNTRFHAATFPVEFASHFISSFSTSSVIDPFIGTGTSIIASEVLKRKCFGLEKEPKYCDITIKRWEDFTGKSAIKS